MFVGANVFVCFYLYVKHVLSHSIDTTYLQLDNFGQWIRTLH